MNQPFNRPPNRPSAPPADAQPARPAGPAQAHPHVQVHPPVQAKAPLQAKTPLQAKIQAQSKLRAKPAAPSAQHAGQPVLAQPVRFAAASAVPAGPPVFRAAPARPAALPASDGAADAPVPSEPIARRIDDALEIAERLIAVLNQENDLLRRHQARGLAALIEEKTALARIYESRVRAVQEAPPAKGEVDPVRATALRETSARLESAVIENTRLLDAAITASQTVVNLIAEAVRESGPQTKAYSAAGQKRAGSRVAAAHAPSLSLDQTL